MKYAKRNERAINLARRVAMGKACSKAKGRAALAELLDSKENAQPGPESLVVLRALAELTDEAGRCPTQDDLAERSGKSKGTVFYHIGALIQRRCVTRAAPGAGRARNYKVTRWGRECLE